MYFKHFLEKNLPSKVLLQIRIGSGFTDFLDPDGAKMLDPDPD
jgi:hypothetical protein